MHLFSRKLLAWVGLKIFKWQNSKFLLLKSEHFVFVFCFLKDNSSDQQSLQRPNSAVGRVSDSLPMFALTTLRYASLSQSNFRLVGH